MQFGGILLNLIWAIGKCLTKWTIELWSCRFSLIFRIFLIFFNFYWFLGLYFSFLELFLSNFPKIFKFPKISINFKTLLISLKFPSFLNLPSWTKPRASRGDRDKMMRTSICVVLSLSQVSIPCSIWLTKTNTKSQNLTILSNPDI